MTVSPFLGSRVTLSGWAGRVRRADTLLRRRIQEDPPAGDGGAHPPGRCAGHRRRPRPAGRRRRGRAAEAAAAEDDGTEGLAGDHRDSLSVFDALTVLAQLGQVLLYKLDGITRQNSNTLWLREVTIACDRPEQPVDREFTATSWISRTQRFEYHGSTWRSAALEGTLGGFTTHCALAHELPAAAAVR